MGEKIMITQEQAHAIESLLKIYAADGILDKHIEDKSYFVRNHEPIRNISSVELAKALYIGYEIEPKYKVRDWVVMTNGEPFMCGELAMEITAVGPLFITVGGDRGIDIRDIRHATTEEIKAEQERRLWKKLDRAVGEFRKGDVRILDDGNSVHITDTDYARAKYIQGALKGFYPAESFISFEEGEEK